MSCQSPFYHMIRVKTWHVIDIKSFSKRLKTCCLRITFKHFVLPIYKGNGSIQILNSSFKQYNTNKKSKSLENNVINREWDQVLRKISTPTFLLAMTFKVLTPKFSSNEKYSHFNIKHLLTAKFRHLIYGTKQTVI